MAAVPPALVTKVATSPAAPVTSLTMLSTPFTTSVICAEAIMAGAAPRRRYWNFILSVGMGMCLIW